MDRERRVVDAFVVLSDTLTEDFDVLETLHRLTDLYVDLLPVPFAMVAASDSGMTMLPTATADYAPAITDELIFAILAGPARDCARSGVPFVNLPISDASRLWPKFGEYANQATFTSCCALPMRLRDEAVGTVILLCDAPAHLSGSDVMLAQRLADAAAIGIVHERAAQDHAAQANNLKESIRTLAVVEQAKGILATQRKETVADADATLRWHARDRNRELADIARHVVTTGTLPESAAGTDETFVHSAVFYLGARQYLQRTVPFVLDGLEAGEPVAVAVPGANLRLIRDAVGDRPRIQWLDMTDVGRNPGWIIPGVLREFADRHPTGRVRIVGEPIWDGRDDTEYPACAQHEALSNLAFAGRQASILCPYDAGSLPPRVLADAAATHPVLIDDDGEHASDRYAPERIVETYNLPLLAPEDAVTRAITPDEYHDVEPLIREQATELSDTTVRNACRVADELIDNTARHGGGTGTLRLWHERSRLVLEVSDHGTIADPLAGRIPRKPDAPGLVLVNQIADLVRCHTGPGGTTVRAYFSTA